MHKSYKGNNTPHNALALYPCIAAQTGV